jgi:hypothetical protein
MNMPDGASLGYLPLPLRGTLQNLPASFGDLGLLYRGLSCWRLTDTQWGFVSLCASFSPLVLASESSCLPLPFDLSLMPLLAL